MHGHSSESTDMCVSGIRPQLVNQMLGWRGSPGDFSGQRKLGTSATIKGKTVTDIRCGKILILWSRAGVIRLQVAGTGGGRAFEDGRRRSVVFLGCGEGGVHGPFNGLLSVIDGLKTTNFARHEFVPICDFSL